MLSIENNFCETLIITGVETDKDGNRILVSTSPADHPGGHKQITKIEGNLPRSGKHLYLGG